MKKEKIIIELLERGDVILTPGGLAQVTVTEELDDYISAGSYYKAINIRWLESTGEHPTIGSKGVMDRGCCTFNWDSKEEDIKLVEKHIKK